MQRNDFDTWKPIWYDVRMKVSIKKEENLQCDMHFYIEKFIFSIPILMHNFCSGGLLLPRFLLLLLKMKMEIIILKLICWMVYCNSSVKYRTATMARNSYWQWKFLGIENLCTLQQDTVLCFTDKLRWNSSRIFVFFFYQFNFFFLFAHQCVIEMKNFSHFSSYKTNDATISRLHMCKLDIEKEEEKKKL